MAADQGMRELVEEPPPLIARLARRFRPREGWIILALTWVGAISLPSAAVEGRLLPGLQVTLLLSTLGLLLGWWLGHRKWRGLLVVPIAGVTGIVADLTWGVYVLDPLPAAWQSGRWLSWWLTCGLRSTCKLPAPPLTAFQDQVGRLADFGERIRWWVNGALTGQGIPDNVVMVGLAGLIAWCLAVWAGWWIARHGRVFLALFPTGFLLPQQVYNADAGQGWLLVFLGSLTCLLVMGRLHRMEHAWDTEGVDYSGELRWDNWVVAIGLVSIVLVLSPLLPSLSPKSISEAFWRTFEEPYSRMTEQVSQSFPGVESRRSLVPPLGVAAGGLPRAHLLGGRPELSREIALRVQVRGARRGEGLYWRGQTYAFYTGHGWEEDIRLSSRYPKPLEFAAGQPWSASQPQMRRNVLASVQVVEASHAVFYGAGEPISLDRPYQAVLRAPGELIALSAAGAPDRYAVLGAVADADPNALRSAPTLYSVDIVDAYLQLPSDLPPGLAAYAAEITSGAETPYDKALAIEEALRKLPYTLDVPVPPSDREVVSWFLFDLRQGYCDYFATAMVVLARLSGVPARLAVGYASGNYDPHTDSYEVTEMDAHSWAEVFFPDFGWIPFEPTPARSVPVRASLSDAPFPLPSPDPVFGNLDIGLAELRRRGELQAIAAQRDLWARRLAGVLGLLLALAHAAGLRRLWAEPRADGLNMAFDRLARWGRRLGRPAQTSDTPREYALAIAAVADCIAADGQDSQMRLAKASSLVQADVHRLAETFEASLFASEPARPTSRKDESRRWAPLWAAMRRLWFARWRRQWR